MEAYTIIPFCRPLLPSISLGFYLAQELLEDPPRPFLRAELSLIGLPRCGVGFPLLYLFPRPGPYYCSLPGSRRGGYPSYYYLVHKGPVKAAPITRRSYYPTYRWVISRMLL